MLAVTLFALTYVVVRSSPFQRTTDVGTKLAPLTVSGNAGLFDTLVFGTMEVSDGTGLPAAVIVRRLLPVSA